MQAASSSCSSRTCRQKFSTFRILLSPTSSMAARRYDSRTTIFSPEGRLYQVEYAVEAISNAGAAIGILATDGVVLASEKKISSKVRPPGSIPCDRSPLLIKRRVWSKQAAGNVVWRIPPFPPQCSLLPRFPAAYKNLRSTPPRFLNSSWPAREIKLVHAALVLTWSDGDVCLLLAMDLVSW